MLATDRGNPARHVAALMGGNMDLLDERSPLLVPRKAGFAMLGCGTTKGDELIKAGQLDARKLGNKTLITLASIRALAANLPKVGAA